MQYQTLFSKINHSITYVFSGRYVSKANINGHFINPFCATESHLLGLPQSDLTDAWRLVSTAHNLYTH